MSFFIRIDEIVQATPLPDIRLILQVIAQNIEIFGQVVTNPLLYLWAQERRELSARGPALVEISRLLETQREGQQAEGQRSEPGKTNGALLPQADEGGNGKTRQRGKKEHTEGQVFVQRDQLPLVSVIERDQQGRAEEQQPGGKPLPATEKQAQETESEEDAFHHRNVLHDQDWSGLNKADAIGGRKAQAGEHLLIQSEKGDEA